MRNAFLVISVLLLFGTAAHAYDVLVVQGLRVKPYEDALRGFRNACGAGIKKVITSETEGAEITRTVRRERPALILAIGSEALSQVRRIRDIPIVYLMVLNPQSAGNNITGVSMHIPPERQLAQIGKILPGPIRVCLLYDPAKTGPFVRKALQAAGPLGIDLVAKVVHSPRDVPEMLNGMKGEINAFWMLPDTTVVTPETVEFFLLFSQELRIPIVTFAGKYVEMGALMSLDIDAFDLGRQAGEMAKRVLEGTPVQDLPRADARRAVLKMNRSVAKKLGISMDSDE